MREFKIFVSGYVNFLRIGGYGAVIVENGKPLNMLSASSSPTTERRIRLLAITRALSVLPEPCAVTVYVDSDYIVNGINKRWARSWRKRNWRISNGEKTKNADLWSELLGFTAVHNIDFVWIRSHNGFEYGHEHNARCYELAIEEVKRGNF